MHVFLNTSYVSIRRSAPTLLISVSVLILTLFCFKEISFGQTGTDSVVFSPLIEVKKNISKWAGLNGFQIEEEISGPEGCRLVLRNRHETLNVFLVPDSPLATRISMKSKGNKVRGGDNILQDFLDFSKYAQENPCVSAEGCNPSRNPDFLKKYRDMVVCIMVYQDHESIQCSGMYLSRLHAVLTTAHEIGKVERIACTSGNGGEFSGELVKIDRSRDLALIKVESFPGLSVPVWKRRDMLTKGEDVYCLGCPLNRGVTIVSGTVDFPRNMNGAILWQINMDVEPGSSGSPVFDSIGYLTGVIKGRYRGVDGKGFIIPIETVKEFIDNYQP